MKRRTRILVLALGALLGGCATAVPVVDFYDASTDALRRFPTIDVLDHAAIEGGAYHGLGPVQGLYCSRERGGVLMHDRSARLQAIDQVKLNAAEIGADAISEPRCSQNRETDLINNCWGKIVCESDAFAAASEL